MAPKAQTARQTSRGTTGRRARQNTLPYPLSSPAAASYRSPPWQQRVDVYAQNYLVPSEIAICRQLGLRYLPTEARLIASQLAGSPNLSLKVRKFIGSLYIFDLSYGLLHDMKAQLRAVLNGGEDIQTQLVENLLNNIRGYRFVKMVKAGDAAASGAGRVSIVEKPWAGDWEIQGAVGNFTPAEPEINMKVLSSTQENGLRSRGYVVLDGMPYSVQRWPEIDQGGIGFGRAGPRLPGARGPPVAAPFGARVNGAGGFPGMDNDATRGNFNMAPYSLTGAGGYAVESCINMLIELCNSKKYTTSDFTNQSRLNVFYPLGLEGANAQTILSGAGWMDEGERQNNMFGMADMMGNAGPAGLDPAFVARNVKGNYNPVGTPQENVLRQIMVPGSITGATRAQNAAVMEHQRMILTQRDLLGKLGQWIETGEGILAYGNVGFSAYREGANPRDIMGNRPATAAYMDANYDNDTCGAGYERIWYTGQPDDPKSQAVPGYLALPGGGRAKNSKAKVATCAPVMPRGAHLAGSNEGPAVRSDLVYQTVPRNGGMAMQRKKKRVTKKR